MKAGRLVRSVLVAAPLALVFTVTGCSSTAGSAESKSAQPLAPTIRAGSEPTVADDAAVRHLLEQANEAWARGDARAYASFHTQDADLIDFRGHHAAGRQEIIDLLQPLFDGALKGTHVEARIVDLRFLSPNVAIFHSEGEIVPTGANSVQTFVATKESDRWLIAAFQNTRIQ